jgi:hypothetical protein
MNPAAVSETMGRNEYYQTLAKARTVPTGSLVIAENDIL